jgi:hypothetical protein
MSEETQKQEASELIVAWGKESYESVASADDEMAAMKRAGLIDDIRVDLIGIETIDDMWNARLGIAGGRFDIIVTFWLDNHHLEENRLHIENIQNAPGTDVPTIEKE